MSNVKAPSLQSNEGAFTLLIESDNAEYGNKDWIIYFPLGNLFV